VPLRSTLSSFDYLQLCGCSFIITSGQVILHKAASPPQTDGSTVFTRWRQCALPWVHTSSQPRWQIDQFSRFLHSSRHKVPIFHNGRPFPSKLSLPMGIWTTSTSWFLGSIWTHNPNGISLGSAIIAQMTAESPYTLQWDASFTPQNCPFPRGSEPLSNSWFPGSTWVLNSNGISIASAVFARLTSATDQQTTLLGRYQ